MDKVTEKRAKKSTKMLNIICDDNTYNNNLCVDKNLTVVSKEVTEVTEKRAKTSTVFECKKCDYICCKKSNWMRHLSTGKHHKVTVGDQKGANNEALLENECDICKKKYRSKNGLWKHKKTCSEKDINYKYVNCKYVNCKYVNCKKEKNGVSENGVSENGESEGMNDYDSGVNLNAISNDKIDTQVTRENLNTDPMGVIYTLIKQNQEFKDLIMVQHQQSYELQKHIVELSKEVKAVGSGNGNINNTVYNTNVTNSKTNNFNMQIFLNEKCKDAMNISDFVKSINLEIADLEKVGQLGYIDGISNIILKNLKALDISQRPMHCSDVKRETMYVKDEDKWEKEDSDNKRLKKAIKYVANKNFQLIPEWKKKYPDCVYSDSKSSDQYNRLLIESVGGKYDTDINETRIIKKIAKEVAIEK